MRTCHSSHSTSIINSLPATASNLAITTTKFKHNLAIKLLGSSSNQQLHFSFFPHQSEEDPSVGTMSNHFNMIGTILLNRLTGTKPFDSPQVLVLGIQVLPPRPLVQQPKLLAQMYHLQLKPAKFGLVVGKCQRT